MSGIATDSITGPVSYPTGGIVVATGLTIVEATQVNIITPGNLGQVEFDTAYSGGNVTIKVMRRNYDKLTALGDLTNLPASVTSPTIAGSTYDTVSHTHAIDHDHAVSPASSTPNNRLNNTLASVAQPAVTDHTHTVNINALVQNAVGETAHSHTFDSIYQHQHSITNTQTDVAMTELVNGTDLSTLTLMIHSIGIE